jgi:hypothetical protein
VVRFGFAGFVVRIARAAVVEVDVGVDPAGRPDSSDVPLVVEVVVFVFGAAAFASVPFAGAVGAGSGFGTDALVPATARGVDTRHTTPIATPWRVRR